MRGCMCVVAVKPDEISNAAVDYFRATTTTQHKSTHANLNENDLLSGPAQPGGITAVG